MSTPSQAVSNDNPPVRPQPPSPKDRLLYNAHKDDDPAALTTDQRQVVERVRKYDADLEAYKWYQRQNCGSKSNVFRGELLGTGILILFGCLAAAQISLGISTSGALGVAAAFGAALYAAARLFPDCNFNPGLSLADLVRNPEVAGTAGIAVVAQLVAAVGAAGAVYFTTGNAGESHLATTTGFWTALFWETLVMTLLILVVKFPADKAGTAVRAATMLFLGVFVLANITGAALNLARAVGPMVWSGNYSDLQVYALATFLAGLISGIILKIKDSKNQKDQESKQEQQTQNQEETNQ